MISTPSILESFRSPERAQVIVQVLLSQIENTITFTLQEVVNRSKLSSRRNTLSKESVFWEKLETSLTSLKIDVNKISEDIHEFYDDSRT